MKVLLPLFSCLAGSCVCATAHAQAPSQDGLYDRLAGDVTLSIGAAASLRQNSGPGGGANASVLYLWSVGPYATFDANLDTANRPQPTMALGLSLRPLFLARWQYDWERGPAWFDLTVDSLTLQLGTVWTWIGEATRAPGFETALAIQIPMQSRAVGPWVGVRGGVQWTARALTGGGSPNSAPSTVLALCIGWSWIAGIHLVDAGDQLLR